MPTIMYFLLIYYNKKEEENLTRKNCMYADIFFLS